MKQSSHIPVLINDVLRLLNPQPGETYFDGTAGLGGHAAEVLEQMGPSGQAILADRDVQAITQLATRFEPLGPRVAIWHTDYLAAAGQLIESNRAVDMILLDLGVSSSQLDRAERGFSFTHDGPLDMRMDQTLLRSAADIVNTVSEKELADLIYEYGEERKSRRIAKAIVRERPIHTTSALAAVVRSAAGPSKDTIHPATRTFQALRIVVNEELYQLEQALPLLTALLNPGGRIVVISFHSLEDRLVKVYFRRESRDCICPPRQPICTCGHTASLKLLTNRPLTGITDAFNPRARSAKLRAAVKLTQK
ncbi:MAG TPA: 16S rRNA (cytosine(1402)-N(4))-methyltransferase RsmH [Candidatus Saccharimonadia bacterium]